MRQEPFGLSVLEDEQPVCRYFKEEPFVGLKGSEVVIPAKTCQAQRAAQPEVEQTTYQPPVGAGVAVGNGGLAGAGETPTDVGVRVDMLVPILHKRWARLWFTIPKGKVSDLMDMMNLLQHEFDRLDVVLSAEQGAVSEQEYENKIREAFRRLGIEVVEGQVGC